MRTPICATNSVTRRALLLCGAVALAATVLAVPRAEAQEPLKIGIIGTGRIGSARACDLFPQLLDFAGRRRFLGGLRRGFARIRARGGRGGLVPRGGLPRDVHDILVDGFPDRSQ